MSLEMSSGQADEKSLGLEAALRARIEGDVRFDDYTRHMFAQDASMYAITPLGVVFPKTTQDVTETVHVAGEWNVPMVPRGAGTSLAGQTVGPGLVIDFSRYMNKIIEVDFEARTAVVEMGVVQDQLNRAVAGHGLVFGPDTSTSNRATIGGMIGNNSAGSGSLVHGMTIDHVLEIDVVFADGSEGRLGPTTRAEMRERGQEDTIRGRIYRELPTLVEESSSAIDTGFPAFWRRAGGYRLDRLLDTDPFDLAKFVVGSEGTLVIATRAMVRLVPKPSGVVYAVGHFTTTQKAIEATSDALSCSPAQVEMMDRTILDLSRKSVEYSGLGRILEGDPEALLFVSFAGDDEDDLVASMERLITLWEEHGHGYHTLRAVTPDQQRDLLKVRKASLGLLMAASEGTRRPLAFVEDTAVPPEHLAEYTARFKSILDEHQMAAGFYGHCSVGCLHVRPFVDVQDPDEVVRMRAVAEQVKDLAREYGGVNSSEHGDGLARSEFNRELFGDDLYEAMRGVKAIFDPHNIMNPGKIVNSPRMTENLRDAALPPVPELRTRLDFEVTGGMFGAADRCQNIGLCRKTDSGVMCPSYMATYEEEHATRGRANALAKALTEPDPAKALGDDRLHEALDLCLMCKACKNECPMSVDMAKLKAEALSQRYDTHGTPIRSRVFGSIRTMFRLGSLMAPISNLPGKSLPLRKLAERTIGITSQRPLPQFYRKNLVRWFKSESPAPVAAARGEVSFIADSFTTYTEPHIGQAAIELLTKSGWDVNLVSSGCCGRASYSKGLLDQAKAQARTMVHALANTPAARSPIVGCEPSCLFTLKDEVLQMLPNDDEAASVAGRVKQVEELLSEAIDSGHLQLRPNSWLSGRRILYHGHCHQKAEVGTQATVDLLRRIPGVEVVEIDAGCCGMAGSFGFEEEHYGISMDIGKDRFLPALQAEPAETIIAASGVSCRQQAFHGAGRSAWHPVELVREAMK